MSDIVLTCVKTSAPLTNESRIASPPPTVPSFFHKEIALLISFLRARQARFACRGQFKPETKFLNFGRFKKKIRILNRNFWILELILSKSDQKSQLEIKISKKHSLGFFSSTASQTYRFHFFVVWVENWWVEVEICT